MEQVRCKHFGLCGGCSFQDVPYEQQLIDKENTVKALSRQAGFTCAVRPINHYAPWYYRNKMEFSFGGNRENLFLGMNAKGGKGIFDVEECPIFSPDAAVVLSAVREFCRARGWLSYNKYNHKGFLRYLIMRTGKFTGEMMVGVVATSQGEFDKEAFVKLLLGLKLRSKLASVFYVKSDSWSDAVVFEEKEVLYGKEFIEERLGEFKFNVGIDSFFQVNPPGILDLYTKIVEYTAPTGGERVLDLFCGVGSIGIFLAQRAQFVWGVELVEAIVAAARASAQSNGLTNMTFFAADARKFLNAQGSFYKGVDLLVINPPRCGLNPRTIRAILKLEAKRIVYSSCNPATLFTDLQGLKEAYQPRFFEPFDFFPHTRHMECLTLLDKIV